MSAMPKRPYSKGRIVFPGRFKSRMGALLLGSALLYLLVSSIFGEMGLIKYYRMRQQCGALSREISALRKDNGRLVYEVYALKNDPAYIERIARDKLGLARPGEIVYYYDGF